MAPTDSVVIDTEIAVVVMPTIDADAGAIGIVVAYIVFEILENPLVLYANADILYVVPEVILVDNTTGLEVGLDVDVIVLVPLVVVAVIK